MTSSELAALLAHHRGAAQGISCAALAQRCSIPERRVRQLVTELRFEGLAIVGTPSTGYYVAQTPDELREFEEFHFQRARHSLAIVSRVRGISMPHLLGQLQLKDV